MLTSNTEALKFDLRDHRAIIYDPHNPQGAVNELVKILASLRDVAKDPESQLADRLGGTEANAQEAFHHALDKAAKFVIANAGLQEPVKITKVFPIPNSQDIAIEFIDFFERRVRGGVDVNGLIRYQEV